MVRLTACASGVAAVFATGRRLVRSAGGSCVVLRRDTSVGVLPSGLFGEQQLWSAVPMFAGSAVTTPCLSGAVSGDGKRLVR